MDVEGSVNNRYDGEVGGGERELVHTRLTCKRGESELTRCHLVDHGQSPSPAGEGH